MICRWTDFLILKRQLRTRFSKTLLSWWIWRKSHPLFQSCRAAFQDQKMFILWFFFNARPELLRIQKDLLSFILDPPKKRAASQVLRTSVPQQDPDGCWGVQKYQQTGSKWWRKYSWKQESSGPGQKKSGAAHHCTSHLCLQLKLNKLSNYGPFPPQKGNTDIPSNDSVFTFDWIVETASLRGVSCRLLSTEMERAKFCDTQSCDIGGHGRTVKHCTQTQQFCMYK